MKLRTKARRGAAAVEAAIVLPASFIIVIMIIAGGVGVFRHQQVACLSHEGARWASVRGYTKWREMNVTPPTAREIATNAIYPRAVSMDPSAITVTVQWVDRGTGTVQDWDASSKDPHSITPAGEYVTNSIRVTVSYQWTPGALIGSRTLTSVCEMPMSN